MLRLVFNDNSTVDIQLDQNPVGGYIEKSFRHLQHLPLEFQIFDYLKRHSQNKDLLYSELIKSAEKLNVKIDISQLGDQQYLNMLHKIYESQYNKGANTWLQFHEMIHAIESLTNIDHHPISDEMTINFRDRAGLLEKSFDYKYLQYAVQSVSQGTCYCRWAELGKVPTQYWLDGEPDDIQRLCQLAKPWTMLRPSFIIALADLEFALSIEQQQKFSMWFSRHQQAWLDYWKLPSWNLTDMSSVIPIGQVINLDQLKHNMQLGLVPTQVQLI